ncbi:MAG TPA: G1 family glutamic endopeptidase [Pseudonocardiaceae bacterium]|nr:G1 family glutamic endopeptidase [Pseudonocardiaceae bacterium]
MARLPSALGKTLCIATAATCLGLAPLAAHANVAQQNAKPSIAGPAVINPHAPHAFGPANQTSTNWFGYVANSGGYNSVQSSWVEPSVDCSKGGGSAVFWVGLDGWGSGTVEQTGTEADCTNGAASYSAWWETYPNNSIQTYDDTVEPGDSLTAKVTFEGNDNYDIYLVDNTQGWTEDNPQQGASGADNQSAEIVGETPGYGNNVYAALPDFNNLTFTDSSVNGQSLGNVNPFAVDLARNGDTLATTGGLSGGTNFGVNWQANS